jgi:predicted secreted protein
MASREQLQHLLKPYLPEDSLDVVSQWLNEYRVALTITRSRQSVFGDYRWPQGGKGHRISVNGDLNPYAFLITFVHEMGHLKAWEKFRNTVPAHGNEWKNEFRELMEAFQGRKIFPADVRAAFRQHLAAPAFSHCGDPQLMKALGRYDRQAKTLLMELPEGAMFRFRKHHYVKGKKMRTRFQCVQLPGRRIFLFNASAPVEPAG